MIDPKLDPFLDHCRWCDRRVVWATVGTGAKSVRTCLDVESSMDKPTIALSVVAGKLVGGRVSAGQAAGMKAAGQMVYVDHALNCQYADKWHKAGANGTANRKYGKR